MRVAILGAGGTIAPAIVRDLAESAEVDELLLLDLDAARARANAEATAAPGPAPRVWTEAQGRWPQRCAASTCS